VRGVGGKTYVGGSLTELLGAAGKLMWSILRMSCCSIIVKLFSTSFIVTVLNQII
jgi:hypothetical protein